MTLAERPFDVGALEALAGGNVSTLAAFLGVDRCAIYRWREIGLTEHLADRFAVGLGLHPGEVWPSWWDFDEAA